MQPFARLLQSGSPILPAAAVVGNAKTGETLAPATRAAVILILVGIALVGILLTAAILLGGHWVRRQGSARRGPIVPPDRAPLEPTGVHSEVDDENDELPP